MQCLFSYDRKDTKDQQTCHLLTSPVLREFSLHIYPTCWIGSSTRHYLNESPRNMCGCGLGQIASRQPLMPRLLFVLCAILLALLHPCESARGNHTNNWAVIVRSPPQHPVNAPEDIYICCYLEQRPEVPEILLPLYRALNLTRCKLSIRFLPFFFCIIE